jgi:hypothetical protein
MILNHVGEHIILAKEIYVDGYHSSGLGSLVQESGSKFLYKILNNCYTNTINLSNTILIFWDVGDQTGFSTQNSKLY